MSKNIKHFLSRLALIGLVAGSAASAQASVVYDHGGPTENFASRAMPNPKPPR